MKIVMKMLELKIMLDEGALMPVRAHETDAGLDLRTPKRLFVPARGSAEVDTGVHILIPEGHAGKLESKSGLNVKYDIISTGLIDAGYTGSIVVKLYNLGDGDVVLERGDKVSQLVINKIETPALRIVDQFPETERGDGGFGSTGR